MPNPFPYLPQADRASVLLLQIESSTLRGNPWGDPATRDVWVIEPAGCAGSALPAILLLPGFGVPAEKSLSRGLSDLPIQARLDRLVADGCPPFRIVLADGMTRIGGSQFVDSPAIGNYATFHAVELTDFVRERFATTGFGVAGKSSGGFGALHLALSHPGRFGAVACHSGDLGFDLCYSAQWVSGTRAIAAAGGPDRLIQQFWSREEAGSGEFSALDLICMSCAYAPDPHAGPLRARLPVDWHSGAVDLEVVELFQRFDPIHRDLAPLRDLRALLVDCGDRDEYGLLFGARRLRDKLAAAGIPHEYAEFLGGHRNTSHRWDWSLPILARSLSA